VIQEYVIACTVPFCVIFQLCWIYTLIPCYVLFNKVERLHDGSLLIQKNMMMNTYHIMWTRWTRFFVCETEQCCTICVPFYVPIIHYYCCPMSYWSNISATWLWMTYHLWMIVESYRELISRVRLDGVKSIEHLFSDSVSFCMYTVTFLTLQHI